MSRRLRALEEALGATLFKRAGDGVTATGDAEGAVAVERQKDPEVVPASAVAGSVRDDIRAFFASLNDDDFDARVPAAVPSGLPVGGRRRAGAR